MTRQVVVQWWHEEVTNEGLKADAVRAGEGGGGMGVGGGHTYCIALCLKKQSLTLWPLSQASWFYHIIIFCVCV